MGHVVGDFRHEDLGGDARHRRGAAADDLGAFLELALLLRMILREVQLHRGQHADHLFLVDLETAANRIAVRRSVQARGGNEIPSSEQQAGTLRSTDAFAP